MAQDYYDILQPFDFIVDLLNDNKATLGLRYIAQHDEELIPQYPAVLVQTDRTDTLQHATGQFLKRFNLDLWVFHAELTVGRATRSRMDIELATAIRRLLHTNYTQNGHIIFGFVNGENPGISARIIGPSVVTIVTTRLTWLGENRVPYEAG